ncbi:MAG: type II secretion system minor pseudopilin GspK [Sphingomonadales bacterium]|nr:type II secretion system minor pseudopilin GspK [Sphingomonadales bacterium]MDE2569332.1 type II secretion system minor pseudopilin GspK [Sphingomonadales bacterium]
MSASFRPPERERGAALLSVLLLVAVMAVIAALMLDRLNLAVRLAGNGQAMTQARLYATSAETLAMARLKVLVDADPSRTVDPGGMLGRDFVMPMARGSVTARIDDAGNCFNVNSLVVRRQDDSYALRLAGLMQLRALMESLAIARNEAIPLSDAMADWIDSDSIPAPNGAEDDWYHAQEVPHLTAGRPIGDVSELRSVKGMTPALYQRLRPWLCALPAAELSPIDLNTLRSDQAPLLSMLAPEAMPPGRAAAIIAARPATGYGSVQDALGAVLPGEAAGQVRVSSRWFLLTQTVRVDSVSLESQSLIDTGVQPPRVAFRSWGGQDSR